MNLSKSAHNDMRGYLNKILPQKWMESTGQEDDALIRWPPRSPDLTPCVFFFWGFVKDTAFVPPLPADLRDLRNRITAAVALFNRDMLTRVWDIADMFAVSAKVYILSTYKLCRKNLLSLSLFQCKKNWYPLRTLFIVNFQNFSRPYD
jgi:hypothetical protein